MPSQSQSNGHQGSQCPPFFFFSFSCYWWVWYWIVCNIPLANLGELSHLCPLPVSCPPPAYSLGSRVGKKEILDDMQALSSSKYHCANSAILATNPEHSTVWAATKNVNSIPAGPSAACKPTEPKHRTSTASASRQKVKSVDQDYFSKFLGQAQEKVSGKSWGQGHQTKTDRPPSQGGEASNMVIFTALSHTTLLTASYIGLDSGTMSQPALSTSSQTSRRWWGEA